MTMQGEAIGGDALGDVRTAPDRWGGMRPGGARPAQGERVRASARKERPEADRATRMGRHER
jgi:hypothetical protein